MNSILCLDSEDAVSVIYPEITEMQARAIIEAACDVAAKGIKVKPEIMIPLVGHVSEFKMQEDIVRRVASEVMKEKGRKINYLVGTMIELPRACVTADEIAVRAEFFSFGTNDLTQTTFGLSRDDQVNSFLSMYSNDLLPSILSKQLIRMVLVFASYGYR
jgi:pyruvate, orthophosphate dikinase